MLENELSNLLDGETIDSYYEDKVLEGSLNSLKNNKIKAIVTEIMFDNVYEKHLSFSDIEKYLIPNNFVFSALEPNGGFRNLFEGHMFERKDSDEYIEKILKGDRQAMTEYYYKMHHTNPKSQPNTIENWESDLNTTFKAYKDMSLKQMTRETQPTF